MHDITQIRNFLAENNCTVDCETENDVLVRNQYGKCAWQKKSFLYFGIISDYVLTEGRLETEV